VTGVRVRRARPEDIEAVVRLRCELWPDASTDEHAAEAAEVLAGNAPGIMPLEILVAETAQGEIAGFIEVGLRSHADGCDPARPVGYVEGWIVEARHRRRGIGALLVAAAEEWARDHGCAEMASDTWIDNQTSIDVHQALGFEIVDRCVNFRKALN